MANPIEPPYYTSGPFATRRKPPSRMQAQFGNVQSGSSGSAGPQGWQPPVQEPESYLRYDTGDGQGMQEWQAGQEPSRGTVSMMTAPENVDRVTGASQLEDLALQQALAGGRREVAMMQPYQPGMQLPPKTIGEAMEQIRSRESAQDTLERLDVMFGNIEKERNQRLQDRIAAGIPEKDAAYEADDYAMRLERRALASAQLAQGRSLPSGAFNQRY